MSKERLAKRARHLVDQMLILPHEPLESPNVALGVQLPVFQDFAIVLGLAGENIVSALLNLSSRYSKNPREVAKEIIGRIPEEDINMQELVNKVIEYGKSGNEVLAGIMVGHSFSGARVVELFGAPVLSPKEAGTLIKISQKK